jgi:two-component system nitrogen regulation sensor histidine kinase GlnL
LSFEDLLQTSCICGVLSIDAGGTVTFISPDAEKILRLTDAEKSIPVAKLPATLQALIQDTQATGRTITDRKIVLNPDRGQSPAISVSVMPAARGNHGQLMVLLKDFSSTRKLEHSLRRLDRLASAGTLSAGMAHEIRNALVAIKTFVDLLLEKNKDDDLAEIVSHEMDRMVSMVSQILKFAVPAQPILAPISIHKILDRALLLAGHRMEGRLISFDRKLQAEKDVLEGDNHQLEQAFVNLLLNAVEAISGAGTLTVATELIAADEGRLREGRYGRGHNPRKHGAPFRAIFHHQTKRHRPRPGRHPPHHRRAQRQHPSREPVWPGNDFYDTVADERLADTL